MKTHKKNGGEGVLLSLATAQSSLSRRSNYMLVVLRGYAPTIRKVAGTRQLKLRQEKESLTGTDARKHTHTDKVKRG